MAKLTMVVELDYDADLMHGGDTDVKGWFFNNVLMGEDLSLHDNGEIGDTVGKITVIEIIREAKVSTR